MRAPCLALSVAVAITSLSSALLAQDPVTPPAPAPAAKADTPKAGTPTQGTADLHFLAPPGAWPARLHHADANVVAAVENGLAWLRRHQSEDGHWDCDAFTTANEDTVDDAAVGRGSPTHDIAATGLAMLAFAREGKPPAGDADQRTLLRAAEWLIAQQQQNGLIGNAVTVDFVYDHAIGTLGLLGVAAVADATTVRDAAGKAVGYLEHHRNPFGVWRYQPRDSDNDSSVTTWCALACAVARDLGLPVDPKAFKCVGAWFDAVTDANGRTGYTKAGEGSSRKVGAVGRFPTDKNETLTAAGLLCRFACSGAPAKVDTRSVALIAGKPPQWQPDDGAVDYCGWFFGGEAMRRIADQQHGAWRQALAKALCTRQRQQGNRARSWDPCDPWGEDGGRIYATALGVLALQSMYALPPH